MPKGHTNNPHGRPRVEDCAAAAIRSVVKKSDWEKAAKSLLHVLYIEKEDDLTGEKTWFPNPDSNGRDKAAAYRVLTDRAFGMATQKVNATIEKAAPMDMDGIDALRKAILDGPGA